MRLAVQESQQAPSLRQRADPRALLGREARRGEGLPDTVGVGPAGRGVHADRDTAARFGPPSEYRPGQKEEGADLSVPPSPLKWSADGQAVAGVGANLGALFGALAFHGVPRSGSSTRSKPM